jgi:putative membrane protein
MRSEIVNSNTDVVPQAPFPKWVSCYLTSEDVVKIEAAIANAEKKTSGEIVPVIVSRCVKLKSQGMKLSALMVLLYCLFVETRLSFFMSSQEMILLGLGFISAASLGPLLLRSSRIRRLMIADFDAAQLAMLRAEVEFYRAGIGGTNGGTGILLFLSIEERQAVVLADKSISNLLPPKTWEDILAMMLNGLKNGNCAGGIIDAVTKCGEILATHFPIQKDDINELPNRLHLIE